jgi:hypothetical protein
MRLGLKGYQCQKGAVKAERHTWFTILFILYSLGQIMFHTKLFEAT